MNFSQWLEQQNIAASSITTKEIRASLFHAYRIACGDQASDENPDSVQIAAAVPPAPTANTSENTPATPSAAGDAPASSAAPVAAAGGDGPTDEFAQRLDRVAAQRLRRQSQVQELCGDYADIAANAIEQGWDDGRINDAVQLRRLQDDRPSGIQASFNINTNGAVESVQTVDAISAALAVSCKVPPDDLIDPFHDMDADTRLAVQGHGDDRIRPMRECVVEAGLDRYSGIALQETIIECLRLDGNHHRRSNFTDATIRASFSSLSLPTVYDNVLNRVVLSALRRAGFKWRMLATSGSVRDFREKIGFRMHIGGYFENLTTGGEIKHGAIEEGDRYTNKADTYAQLLMLDRRDFINDDTGALSGIGRSMSFYGASAPEIAVFDLFENSGHFTAGAGGNMLTGVPLSYDNVKALWEYACRNLPHKKGVKKDTDRGRKLDLDIEPGILLTHKCRALDVDEILSPQVTLDTSGTGPQTVPVKNVLTGRLKGVATKHLKSEDDFYLVNDPMDVAPSIEVVFLNNVQRPTIQRVEAMPQFLGHGFRGWIDFGVAWQHGAWKGRAA